VINLIGEYSCKVDAKGRVMLPSAFKKQLASVLEKGFVLKQSIYDACLELYPMPTWDETMAKVATKNRFDKETNDFIRRFSAGVKLIELDGTGRFLISKNLCNHANIKKEITMISLIDRIEIWNSETYQAKLEAEKENFAKLVHKVMVDSKTNENE
jgi:MraZ protein